MNFIIVGCGRLGAELAYRLYSQGNQVTVIDRNPLAFNNLDPTFSGRTIEGEALNKAILQRAGAEHADGLAAVTNSDTLNAVVAHAVRMEFRVPQIYVRNYDPYWRPLHEAFGLHMVSSSSWGAQRIEELLYHAEIRTVFSAGNGEVDVYEFTIPAAWIGHPLNELISDIQCAPVAITRAGRSSLTSPDMILQQDDILSISATLEGIQSIRQRLMSLKEA
jgi:trk system potassium uptake protein TrkA